MAVALGFEPRVAMNHTDFRDLHLRPLGHATSASRLHGGRRPAQFAAGARSLTLRTNLLNYRSLRSDDGTPSRKTAGRAGVRATCNDMARDPQQVPPYVSISAVVVIMALTGV